MSEKFSSGTKNSKQRKIYGKLLPKHKHRTGENNGEPMGGGKGKNDNFAKSM